jgi:hypothetical protein
MARKLAKPIKRFLPADYLDRPAEVKELMEVLALEKGRARARDHSGLDMVITANSLIEIARALVIACDGDAQMAHDAVTVAVEQLKPKRGRGHPPSWENNVLLAFSSHIQRRDKIPQWRALMKAAGGNKGTALKLHHHLHHILALTLLEYADYCPMPIKVG